MAFGNGRCQLQAGLGADHTCKTPRSWFDPAPPHVTVTPLSQTRGRFHLLRCAGPRTTCPKQPVVCAALVAGTERCREGANHKGAEDRARHRW